MADDSRIFQVEIITPDRIFHTGEATMIEFNTAAGELGVYKNHIPLTTVLAPGIVKIHKDGDEDVVAAVHSGFAEILPDKVTLLAEIAESTGGRYFRATDNTKLAEIYSEINKMEKARTTVDSFPVYKELFGMYALLALIAILLELLLNWFVIRRLP